MTHSDVGWPGMMPVTRHMNIRLTRVFQNRERVKEVFTFQHFTALEWFFRNARTRDPCKSCQGTNA